MKKKKEKRNGVVGYIRVSTKEQAVEGYSLENQEREIQEYCEYHKLTMIDEVCSDKGVSGASVRNRSGLKRAVRLAIDEKAEYLVVWKVSRLGRRLQDVVNIVQELEDNGVYLRVLEGNIDTKSLKDKQFLHFAGIFSEMERESIIVQVRAGMRQKALNGEWCGGPPPLGYDLF